MAHPSRFINFSTKQSRELVRSVLAPYPLLGLRIQDIYHQIHEKFPNAKEAAQYVPEMPASATEHWKNLGMFPEHPEHPVRSMKHLKKSVIPDMVLRREVQEVLIQEKGDATIAKFKYPPPMKSVYETLSERVLDRDVKSEWRWRLCPDDIQVDDKPDPDWEEVRQKREEMNRNVMGRERMRQERKYERRMQKRMERRWR